MFIVKPRRKESHLLELHGTKRFIPIYFFGRKSSGIYMNQRPCKQRGQNQKYVSASVLFVFNRTRLVEMCRNTPANTNSVTGLDLTIPCTISHAERQLLVRTRRHNSNGYREFLIGNFDNLEQNNIFGKVTSVIKRCMEISFD